MSLHRLLAAALVAPALLLTGCGEDPKPQTPDAGVDVEAYFGLQKGRCYEYTTGETSTATTAPDLGVIVEQIDQNQFQVPTHAIYYWSSGLVMQDYVSFKDNELLLHKRNIRGGKSFIYEPAISLMKVPVQGGERFESKAITRVYDSTGKLTVNPPQEATMQVDLLQPQEIRIPAGVAVTGMKTVFSHSATTRREVRTLVPGTGNRTALDGWVTIDYNFTPDDNGTNIIYKLMRVRDLGDDPEAIATCGSAP